MTSIKHKRPAITQYFSWDLIYGEQETSFETEISVVQARAAIPANKRMRMRHSIKISFRCDRTKGAKLNPALHLSIRIGFLYSRLEGPYC